MKIRIQKEPRQIFLLDGMGAIISIFMLGIVLVNLESYFGIPKHILYLLATLPIFFLVYDIYCFRKNIVTKRSIQIIAITNISYCILSAILTGFHYEEITLLGWLYIVIEIIIVALVAILELKLSKKISDTTFANE